VYVFTSYLVKAWSGDRVLSRSEVRRDALPAAVQQVRRAVKLGLLHDGDQLPTVKDVVGKIAINPNTVSKAYRELEHQGLSSPNRVGTFVAVAPSDGPPTTLRPLQRDLNAGSHGLVMQD